MEEKVAYVHREYYSAFQKGEILSFAVARMEAESTMLMKQPDAERQTPLVLTGVHSLKQWSSESRMGVLRVWEEEDVGMMIQRCKA
jgi:hypothetical protein